MNSKWNILIVSLFLSLGAMASDGQTFQVSGEPDLSLQNISGDINITQGDSGVVEVNWTIEDDRISVETEQEGDNIQVKVVYPKGNNFNINGGVSFEIRFPAKGELGIQTVSGNINITDVRGELELNSVSGDVSVNNSGGELEITSVSGKVILENIGSSEVEASSVSGKVYYSGDLEGGDYGFSSVSGEVHLSISESASFELDGNTIGGTIDNQLGGNFQEKKAKYGPTTTVSGSHNGGSVEVSVSSISGKLVLKWL